MLAECGRESGSFSKLQPKLIAHLGPWTQKRLLDLDLDLVAELGIDRDRVGSCLANVAIGDPVEKDREHSRARALRSFPAVTVNGTHVASDEASLRRAILSAL